MRWLTRLTTAVIGVGVVLLLVVAIRAKLPSTTVEGSFPTWAKFRDGSRITVGSPVVIAGVQIGQITGLNESQVKVYIYRARLFLKQYIGSWEVVV